MADDKLYDVWWTGEEERSEDAMERGHSSHWKLFIDMIEESDLSEYSVMDFGCNQGAFLRFLYEQRPFKQGLGIDLAQKSIETAAARKGTLPIEYEATGNPETHEGEIDIAFSMMVIYLLEDLPQHAAKLKKILRPGGVYYASFTEYIKSPAIWELTKDIAVNTAISMQFHSLSDIASAFRNEGFNVSLRRMQPSGYIDVTSQGSWASDLSERMRLSYDLAYMFRFTAPQRPE